MQKKIHPNLAAGFRRRWDRDSEYGIKAIGKRFGSLTVIAPPSAKIPNYKLRCDCGRLTVSSLHGLLVGRSTRCMACRVKSIENSLVGQDKNDIYVIKCFKDGKFLVRCELCENEYVLTRQKLHIWLRKKSSGCHLCSLGKRGPKAEMLTVDGQTLPMPKWTEFLQVSRQRVSQLKISGQLVSRIKEQMRINETKPQ